MTLPNILFGAGGIDSPEDLRLKQLDSAASYPPGAPWVTETLLGQAKAAQRRFGIDTKILVIREGSLSEEYIDSSLKKSLELLGIDKVNILYAHKPDLNTPIEESARAFDKHFKAGRFKELGLCNCTTAQMREWLAVCGKSSYVKPTVYQGHYNTIDRQAERDLFPLLRENNVRIVAYGPLAGGFLTGKVSIQDGETNLSKGRWAPGNFPQYPAIFNKPKIHAVMRKFHRACAANGLTSGKRTFDGLCINNSELREGDGIILGATKVDQLVGNIEACKKGPLQNELLDAADELWAGVKGEIKDLS